MEYIPFCQPHLLEEDIDEVVDTLKSGWIGTGPKTKIFEDLLARFTGARHAIALNSCTAGLHLSLKVAGIKPGDEVITSPMTFCATANSVIHLGAKPVFVDVSPGSFNINAQAIERKITAQTRALIPVHMAGLPCHMSEIQKVARKFDLVIIEDAAHALESWCEGRKVGIMSDFTAFSFYATKNITTGEGGVVTTDHDEYAAKIRILSLHGMCKDAWKRYLVKGMAAHFDVVEAGYKYNMFDIQAALGIHQIKRIDQIYTARKKLFDLYRKGFENVREITLQELDSTMIHAHHLFIILLNLEMLKVDRDTFRKLLEDAGIGTGIHFKALHLQPYYQRNFGYQPGDFPVAESISERTLSLPLYLGLTGQHIEYIVDTVTNLLRLNRR